MDRFKELDSSEGRAISSLKRLVALLAALLVILIFSDAGHTAPLYQLSPIKVQESAPGQVLAVVQKTANLRAGPSVSYAVVGRAEPGQMLPILGCNDDCTWYQVGEDCWIAAFLVETVVPVASAPSPAPGVIGQPLAALALATPTATLPAVNCPQTAGDVTLYGGPGDFYPAAGSLPARICVAVVGRNQAGDWFQLSDGHWIAAAAVRFAEPIQFIPITDQTPTPTFTPAPAATPAPTATPTPVIPPEEQAYLSEVAGPLEGYRLGLAKLEPQLSAWETIPAMVDSNLWLLEIAAAATSIQASNNAIRLITPPPRLSALHDELLAAAGHYEQALALLTQGINARDVTSLPPVQAELAAGAAAIQRAQQELVAAGYPETVLSTIGQPPATEPDTPAATSLPSSPPPPQEGCDPNYAGACIPIVSDDLNCEDIPERGFWSIGSDPHDFDRDEDGIACEP